ncbi:MAG: hemolysin, partial [Gallionella sp.]|nr:hemolysin [Gallionella sp.]
MSGYTVEVRTGILTGANDLHTWLYITKPDGSREAWGFHPAPDGNILYGPGDVQAESVTKQYTSTSGPLSLTQNQYDALMNNIAAQDAAPPDYSVLSLPGGVQCSMWAVDMLQRPGVDLIPSTISPEITPELIPILDALIWNPLVQTAGFEAYELLQRISEYFTAAQRFIPRRDPLTLDLNGNGIETLPINATNPVYFDLTGEGVQTSVGWIAPNDGFLVLDRNGNGSIDDGTELFGDATPAYEPGTTVPASTGSARTEDGFAALAQEDTNADGVVNSADANFASLRVWQDLNQDGISQAGELKTLSDLGIESFNVASINHSQLLANGNQIADTGSYT